MQQVTRPPIQASGITSLCGVAKALSARGIKTARGGAWTVVQVSNILTRSGLPCVRARTIVRVAAPIQLTVVRPRHSR